MNFNEFLATSWDPFDLYRVKIHLSNIAGGIPMQGDLISGWVDATNKSKTAEDRNRIKEATIDELGDLAEETASRNGVTFKKDPDHGLYVEGRQIKAMLKESANIIKDLVRGEKKGKKGKESGDPEMVKGISGFKSKVADRVFVVEKKVYLGREKADRTEERAIHVMTRQGPRTSLKRVDIVDDVEIEFTVRRLRCKEVPEEALYGILAYSRDIGLGAERSQGRGTFQILAVDKIKEDEKAA